MDTSSQPQGRWVKLTPEQMASANRKHREYCARIWENADDALRAQLEAAPWFEKP